MLPFCVPRNYDWPLTQRGSPKNTSVAHKNSAARILGQIRVHFHWKWLIFFLTFRRTIGCKCAASHKKALHPLEKQPKGSNLSSTPMSYDDHAASSVSLPPFCAVVQAADQITTTHFRHECDYLTRFHGPNLQPRLSLLSPPAPGSAGSVAEALDSATCNLNR